MDPERGPVFEPDDPTDLPEPPDSTSAASRTRPDPVPRAAPPDLAGLAIAGITRRRVAWVLAAIVSVWIVFVFARQVADAGAAADRATQMRLQNVGLASQVDDLQKELDLVQRQAFIEQEARAYGLGARGERPFTLAPGADPLAADAPGSAEVRLGARPSRSSPLDSWLELLFGPTR
jgi:cell division protein FtsB